MSKRREYVEPEDVHEYIYDLGDLSDKEFREVIQELLDTQKLLVYRSNRNKHSETRMVLIQEE